MAHLRPRTNSIGAVARVRHCLAQAIHRFFHEQGYFWVHTPIITASDCRGRRRAVPGQHAGPGQSTAHARGRRRLRRRTSSASETFLTVSGQLNVESLLPGAVEGLHLWSDVPRRELQHQPPSGRILDGGAGNRLRGPACQRRSGRGTC
ncbi:MAG: hypothetical protein MZU84_05425 [Sphingobacterium sp.]|nr:hypothetical protein [Sphingobacterium sp.]